MAVDRHQLEAAIGPRAEYYLRRFEKIDSGRKAGWNWAAFFFSSAWFSYRGLGGWAALNLFAPWLAMILAVFTIPTSGLLGVAVLLLVYPVAFFILVPMYADVLYYERVRRRISVAADGGKPSSPARPIAAVLVGTVMIVLPASLAAIAVPAHLRTVARMQLAEAISLMSGARTPLAEHFANHGKWPESLKQVAENTSGRYTERIEITSGAGAASGALVMTATMRKSGVRSEVAGKTVQYRSEDGGKTWTCSHGAVDGAAVKYLPAACR